MLVSSIIYHFMFLIVLTSNLCVFTCLQLESAIADEMTTLKGEWEAVLDDLETESACLLVCF